MFRFLVALGVLLGTGCAGNVTDESVASDELAVYGGAASGPEDDFVVRLEALNSIGLRVDCSGALVAPRLLLTARHCLVNFVAPPFQCDANGELISPGDGGKFGNAHDPKTISVFFGPGYPLEPVAHGVEILSADTPSVCRDDVAFLVLDHDLTAPKVPLRLFQPVVVGESVSVIGYGLGETTGKVFRKRAAGLPVESVGPDVVDPSDDSQTPPRSFALGRSTCPGDSGGPVQSDETGALLGVTSWSSDACGLSDVRNFFPRIGPHSELVSEAFAKVGAEPWVEGTSPDGNSAACDDCGGSSGCGFARSRRVHTPLAVFVLLALCAMRDRGSRART